MGKYRIVISSQRARALAFLRQLHKSLAPVLLLCRSFIDPPSETIPISIPIPIPIPISFPIPICD